MKNHLYINNTLTLVCCRQNTANYRTSKKHGITKIQKNVKAEVSPPERNSRILKNKEVWLKSKRRNMPPKRRIIDSKWVFKKKIDDWFRKCLVAQSYTQFTTVYFTNNYSLVVTYITLFVTVLMWFINRWYSHNIDAKIAAYTQY